MLLATLTLVYGLGVSKAGYAIGEVCVVLVVVVMGQAV